MIWSKPIQVKTICLYTLRTFYNTPYRQDGVFYEQFEQRLAAAYTALDMD